MSTPSLPSWVAIADGGPVMHLTDVVGMRTIHADSGSRRVRRHAAVDPPAHRDHRHAPAGADEVAAALRERRRRPALRVVVVSPSDAIAERLEALRAGADEAHPDTIDPAELGARLALLEERTRPRHDAVLIVTDDTELDLVAHEVRRAGSLIHLRPKEFQLLAMLAAHPGRAYSRRQLLDRVWGPNHDGDPRTVDVHIRWLRSKIEPQPDVPTHLVTVRGVGYRLDPSPR